VLITCCALHPRSMPPSGQRRVRSAPRKGEEFQEVRVLSKQLSVWLGSIPSGGTLEQSNHWSTRAKSVFDRRANTQAATRVNPEQAPKEHSWMSTRLLTGEDHCDRGRNRYRTLSVRRGIGSGMRGRNSYATREAHVETKVATSNVTLGGGPRGIRRGS